MSISKQIRVNDGSNRSFETITTSELQFDLVPEVGSFRPVTSDGVAKALEVATEIPVVSAETNGKVLTASWNSETGTGSTSWEESQGGVPQVTENDNGKVLTAIYDAGGPAVEWAEPAVDQTYDAESTNAQSGVAVASAIGTVNQVPASTSSDEGKVLTVDANGDTGWSTPAVPTVDQTYDATSTNAQSGTAVAEAIADVNAVPSSAVADAGKVLTVGSNGDPEWDAVQAAGGTRLTSADDSALNVYPDGSSAVVSVSHFIGNRLYINSTSSFENLGFTPQASNTLMRTYEPISYKGNYGTFTLDFGYSSYSTVIPSGYKAAWCQDTGKTRYYIVESGATLPTNTSLNSMPIYYLSKNTSITYLHHGTCYIPYPPSVRPDYTPDLAKYTKVGDWSSVTSDVHQWYLGFVNPSTGTWLTLPTENVSGTLYIRAGALGKYGLQVLPELPSVTTSDAGSVLKVSSGGAWAKGTVSEVPAYTSADAGKVLAVNSGATGTEWVAGGGTSYADITIGTAVISRDNAVVTSTADITSVTVGANVKQAVVQWTVSSTTTLPTVVDAGSNPLKAASNNPSALTVGKTYQLSILNGCYVIAEFA